MTREDAILHMTLRREELKHSVGDLDEDIKAFDMAIKALEQTRWIPCSERSPEKPDNYPRCGIYRTYFLVTLESGCVKSLGYEFDSDRWQITGSPVIAWMPLPQPYNGESEDAE